MKKKQNGKGLISNAAAGVRMGLGGIKSVLSDPKSSAYQVKKAFKSIPGSLKKANLAAADALLGAAKKSFMKGVKREGQRGRGQVGGSAPNPPKSGKGSGQWTPAHKGLDMGLYNS